MLPRRAELALRAFPKRFRSVRADEMRGVFADAADAGDTRVFGPRALADLVVAGWRERLRTRPPLRSFLAYRLVERRLPEPYHRWMFDDVGGRWYLCRRLMWSMLPSLTLFGALALAFGLPLAIGPFAVGWGAVSLAVVILSAFVDLGAGHRRRVLSRHGYDPEMRWLPPPTVGSFVPAPPRPGASPVVPWSASLGLALVAAGAAGATVLWWPSLTPHVRFGTLEISRSADHTRTIAIAVAVAAVVAATLGLALLGRVRARFVVDSLPPEAVERSRPVTFVPAALVVAMGMASMLPITPMVVPAALVVLAGGAPPLLALAVWAHRRNRRDQRSLWVVFDARRVVVDGREPR